MATENPTIGYRLYWRIWLILLVLTVGMIFLDQAPMGRGVVLTILVVAMLTKVALVTGYFMHLRFESLALGLTVAIGLLVTGAVLFLLIVPDAYRILDLSSP
jgi:caa(3)-type oxidase subunit IV